MGKPTGAPLPLNPLGIAHFDALSTIAKQYLPLVRVRINVFSYRKDTFTL